MPTPGRLNAVAAKLDTWHGNLGLIRAPEAAVRVECVRRELRTKERGAVARVVNPTPAFFPRLTHGGGGDGQAKWPVNNFAQEQGSAGAVRNIAQWNFNARQKDPGVGQPAGCWQFRVTA